MPQSEAEMKSSNAAAVTFDYEAGAELFMTRRHRSVGYLRFDRAAEAIRFAIEDLPPQSLQLARLQVEEARFDGREIRRLYDCAEFPLARRRIG
jgi:hypothetical protein